MLSPVYDDTEWTPEEMIALAERAFDEADLAGPIEWPAATSSSPLSTGE